MLTLHSGIVVCVGIIGCLFAGWLQVSSRAVEPTSPAAVVVALPTNAQGFYNSEAMLPVTIQGVDGQAIFSYQFTVRFDPAVLAALGVSMENSVSTGWSVAENHQTPGEWQVAAFNTTPLTNSGRLLTLHFTVVGHPPLQTAVTWQRLLINEGQPAGQVVDGTFRVDAGAGATVTPTPTLSPVPTTVTPPPRATVRPPDRTLYLPLIRR